MRVSPCWSWRRSTDRASRSAFGEIAERHDVPPRFLVQILLQLKGAGLVASVRGAAGGYQLLKPPQEISLGQVMEVIDGHRTTTRTDQQRLARFARRQGPSAGLERGRRRAAQDARRHHAGRSARTGEGTRRADVSHLNGTPGPPQAATPSLRSAHDAVILSRLAPSADSLCRSASPAKPQAIDRSSGKLTGSVPARDRSATTGRIIADDVPVPPHGGLTEPVCRTVPADADQRFSRPGQDSGRKCPSPTPICRPSIAWATAA